MDNWLMLVKEEYVALRNEATQTDQNAQSILKFGLATIGVVIGMGITTWDDSVLSGLVFSVFVPTLCYLFLTIWMGEFARKIRVAHYILEVIEPKLKDVFNDKKLPLEWESWLRKTDKDKENRLFKWNRFAAIIVFLGFSIVSVGVGLYQLFSNVSLIIFILIAVVELSILVIIILYNYAIGKNFN